MSRTSTLSILGASYHDPHTCLLLKYLLYLLPLPSRQVPPQRYLLSSHVPIVQYESTTNAFRAIPPQRYLLSSYIPSLPRYYHCLHSNLPNTVLYCTYIEVLTSSAICLCTLPDGRRCQRYPPSNYIRNQYKSSRYKGFLQYVP